jgi:putative transcriptional regulator
MSKTIITVRTTPDGRLRRKTDAGWEELARERLAPTPPDFVPPYDPDNLPWTPEQRANRKRVPRVNTLRRQLSLTQEQFAERYHIPIGTLRDWEQGRSEPEAPAKALLKLIAADPEGSAQKLKLSVLSAAE